MLSSRLLLIVAILSLCVPIGLLLVPATDSPDDFAQQLPFRTSNWLYMSAPPLLVIVCAALIRRTCEHFAVPALIALTMLLAGF